MKDALTILTKEATKVMKELGHIPYCWHRTPDHQRGTIQCENCRATASIQANPPGVVGSAVTVTCLDYRQLDNHLRGRQ